MGKSAKDGRRGGGHRKKSRWERFCDMLAEADFGEFACRRKVRRHMIKRQVESDLRNTQEIKDDDTDSTSG